MSIFINIGIWIIGFIVLYLIIKAAIDDSDTAKEIREIRKLLQLQCKSNDDNADSEPVNENLKDYEILDVQIDNCPACGAKVLPNDNICSDCGLSLR